MALDPRVWLDKVRAVPLVGLRLNPTFESAATMLEHFRPILMKWNRTDETRASISMPNAFHLKVERSDGFEINASHESLACKFYYLSKIDEKGPRLPSMTYQTGLRKIDDLLASAINILDEVAQGIWKTGHRAVERVGVVVAGSVDSDGLPPGFSMFINHVSSPWSDPLLGLKGRYSISLGQGNEVSERCHHELDWDGGDAPLKFGLDWQRLFHNAKPMPFSKLKSELESCGSSAFEYFGKFGLGELNYDARS